MAGKTEDAYQIHSTSNKLVPHTGTILGTTTTNQDNRVLLHIVAYTQRTLVAMLCHASIRHPSIPSPGMYAHTSFPLLNLTLATLRSPELGFLGFVIPTLTQTPFISGRSFNWGEVSLRAGCGWRQPRRTWL